MQAQLLDAPRGVRPLLQQPLDVLGRPPVAEVGPADGRRHPGDRVLGDVDLRGGVENDSSTCVEPLSSELVENHPCTKPFLDARRGAKAGLTWRGAAESVPAPRSTTSVSAAAFPFAFRCLSSSPTSSRGARASMSPRRCAKAASSWSPSRQSRGATKTLSSSSWRTKVAPLLRSPATISNAGVVSPRLRECGCVATYLQSLVALGRDAPRRASRAAHPSTRLWRLP
mmetsp:Transcript_5774/g.17039  ORF Transcript_5774/g.17039 Transcript_5774/m.17039 type:complete len:227 (+) Transcript_5774:558-1238(+)